MKFKEFLQMCEAQGGGDNGLMGLPVASSVRKPSDGQPFKQYLGPASGQTPRGAQAAPVPAMMKKKMSKR